MNTIQQQIQSPASPVASAPQNQAGYGGNATPAPAALLPWTAGQTPTGGPEACGVRDNNRVSDYRHITWALIVGGKGVWGACRLQQSHGIVNSAFRFACSNAIQDDDTYSVDNSRQHINMGTPSTGWSAHSRYATSTSVGLVSPKRWYVKLSRQKRSAMTKFSSPGCGQRSGDGMR